MAGHARRPRRTRRHGPLSRRLALLAVVVAGAACGGGRSRVTVHAAPPSRGMDSAAVRAIDPVVGHRSFRNATWGILVVDAASGDTVYARNPEALLVPASNQKLITGAVALHTLGPAFRFTTLVAATGPIRQGTLQGDLVILGTGDPTFSDRFHGDALRPLRAIADSLYRLGIRRVSGRLVSGLDAFPDASVGQGWAWDDLDRSYAAGVDELLLNEGVTRLRVVGGPADGAPVEVRTAPARTFPPVRVTARTAGGGQPEVWVARDDGNGSTLTVAGRLPPRAVVELEVTNRNQTVVFLEALREALTERGITVAGGVTPRPLAGGGGLGGGPSAESRARPSPGPGRSTLFSLVSPPLAQVLAVFQKSSVNQIGEALLKTLGRLRTGSGTYESGIDAVKRQLITWGAAADGFVVRDGSGLSRLNVVSAETLVRVLLRMRQDTASATFLAALPVAGVDGTLGRRLGGGPTRGNVRAKTGSLEQVRALSGYVTTADGRQLAFAVLCNNWTVSAETVETAIDEIVLRLARLRRPGR